MDYVDSLRSQIQQNGFALVRTSGRSMRPIIWGGDHCVAIGMLNGEPAVGDVLMFRQGSGTSEKCVAHRLVKILRSPEGELLYITRGDNCVGTEEVRPSDIIGRVVEVHRLSGFRPWHVIPARKFAVTDRSYRCYAGVWSAIWPLRRWLYRIRAAIMHRLNS